MLDGLRSKAFGALRSSFGNGIAPVRWTKDLLLFVNEMAGKPLAPADEIAERRDREKTRRVKVREARDRRHDELRAERAARSAKRTTSEAAPVVVYIDDNSRRELARIRTVLKGREISFRELDVEHDEASKSWACTTSGRRELPIVFVGDRAVGAYDELIQLDVTGELTKLVYGR